MLPAGSACNWKVCGTAFAVPLLYAEATKRSGCEFLPAVELAVPVAG